MNSMKVFRLLLVLVVPGTFGAACVRSHHAMYYPPAPGPVVVAPTSDRPVERVYPPIVTVPSTPPPDVNSADVAVAASVSQLLKADRGLSDATRNVEASVDGGVVTLRGTVPTDHDRDEIVERISRIPGVTRVRDHLGVELR